MKTRLIWKKCRLLEDKDAFWIECTDEEVASQIIPLIDDNKIKTPDFDTGTPKIGKISSERSICLLV